MKLKVTLKLIFSLAWLLVIGGGILVIIGPTVDLGLYIVGAGIVLILAVSYIAWLIK